MSQRPSELLEGYLDAREYLEGLTRPLPRGQRLCRQDGSEVSPDEVAGEVQKARADLHLAARRLDEGLAQRRD